MKKLFITLVCLSVGALAANAQKSTGATASSQPATTQAAPAANPNGPKFKFKEETHDFGELKEGPEAKYAFEFTNAGKEPLIIQNATGSCGCTVPDWPKQPILPGKKGVINVTYHTQGRVGPFMKDVYIQSNAGTDRYTIHIKGTVKANPNPTVPAVNNNGTTNH
ncbi:MAG: DUF1573 domain-containing protein [Bacteroidetes bacterium]|nr:DUF1573 domain-containing protein [Bacteroidota bacterium]